VEFFLDDSLIFSYSSLLYSSGYIRVKATYEPIAYWDNIKVSSVDGILCGKRKPVGHIHKHLQKKLTDSGEVFKNYRFKILLFFSFLIL